VLQKNLGFLATGKIGGYSSVRAPLQFLHESIFRHSPSFTATAEKKGWIVSKANKTGQFSIITTTPDVRTFHNYPTVYDGPPLVSLGLVALCGTPDDFALQNLLVVIKKGNIQMRPPHPSTGEEYHTARHPGAGRDPVDDKCRQPVSFGIITQVCFRKLDTALRRYDDSGAWITAV
jgi:hypothetical protein